MVTRIYTSRVSYGGRDRLDITRKSGSGRGLAFAPSWAILRPALDARRSADALRGVAMLKDDPAAGWATDEASIIEAEAWEAYVPAFVAEMRESYRTRRDAWTWLLSREEVTLVCFCTDASQCHRTLLGEQILPRLGAVFCGEREAAEQRRGGVR